jgi:hypothetical protein
VAGVRILAGNARHYAFQPMNVLIVGADNSPLLQHLPDRFLLIDDGDFAAQIGAGAKLFDPKKHCLNPLKDMDELKADTFISVLNGAFPEGENTLTRRYSNHILFKRLLEKPGRLDKLMLTSKDPYERDAFEKIERLLLSPVLERVLNSAPSLSFSFGKRNIARLNRAELGDFNCFILGNLLISQFQGAVVVPQFGFFAIPAHKELIAQGRLIAGINFFDEVPELRNELLLIEKKIGRLTTPDDARLLAEFEGLIPGTVEHTDWVYRTIKGHSHPA